MQCSVSASPGLDVTLWWRLLWAHFCQMVPLKKQTSPFFAYHLDIPTKWIPLWSSFYRLSTKSNSALLKAELDACIKAFEMPWFYPTTTSSCFPSTNACFIEGINPKYMPPYEGSNSVIWWCSIDKTSSRMFQRSPPNRYQWIHRLLRCLMSHRSSLYSHH